MESNLPIAAAFGAFSLGLMHSLIPSHWLPVVLLSKARKWSVGTSLLGAVVAASGHILISIVVGIGLVLIGATLFAKHLELIEDMSAFVLIGFGLLYAGHAWFRHSSCHGHSHHGETIQPGRPAFLFLFSLGLTPCATVLPAFVTAAASGTSVLIMALVGFAAGVLTALIAATLLTLKGVADFDLPVFEHYGDVITGLAASGLGLIFWLFHDKIHPHL